MEPSAIQLAYSDRADGPYTTFPGIQAIGTLTEDTMRQPHRAWHPIEIMASLNGEELKRLMPVMFDRQIRWWQVTLSDGRNLRSQGFFISLSKRGEETVQASVQLTGKPTWIEATAGAP